MSKKNNYRDKTNLHDYVMFCDICAMRCWASKSTILDKFTGKGNLIVCPVCVDIVDYGLVPYTVKPEKNPKYTRNNHYAADPQDVPTFYASPDFSTYDPLSGESLLTWNYLETQIWNEWYEAWGT